MTFTFPKSALPLQPSLSQRMQRHTTAQAEYASRREIYRKVKESEKATAEQITQSWKAATEARIAEQTARAREAEAVAVDDNE